MTNLRNPVASKLLKHREAAPSGKVSYALDWDTSEKKGSNTFKYIVREAGRR